MDLDTRNADSAYYDMLAEEEEMRPVPDLNTLVIDYLSSGMEPEEAFSLASVTRDSIIAENERIRLDRNFQKSINKSSAFINSATTQKLAEHKSSKRAIVEQKAKEKEDQEFIQGKMTDLEPFLMVLSRTDKALHDKIMEFITNANAISLEDPGEIIRKELRKTRPGKTEKGKEIIDQYFADPFDLPDDDFFGGKQQRKSRKQRKSKKNKRSRRR